MAGWPGSARLNGEQVACVVINSASNKFLNKPDNLLLDEGTKVLKLGDNLNVKFVVGYMNESLFDMY
jgi:hypothetical protein